MRCNAACRQKGDFVHRFLPRLCALGTGVPALILAAALLGAFPGSAQETVPPDRRPLSDRLQFSGSWETEWAVGLDDGSSRKLEFQLQPRIAIELPRDMDWTTILRIRADAFDELEPGSPGQPEIAFPSRRVLIGDRIEAELRECYLETEWNDTYLVIGKQQTVWGKADGLKVLDVVNPQDYREFILDDWEDSRIPLWTLKAEVPVQDMMLQLLWIPDTTGHRLPQEDSLFYVTAGQPDPPDIFHIEVHDPNRPDRFMEDSDLGLRLTAFKKGWDLSFNYLYHYDDTPALRREFGLSRHGPTVHVHPEYGRSHLIGATFSNAFGDATFRGEVALNLDRYFSAAGLGGERGVIKSDQVAYVLGVDWFGVEETFLSVQFFQDWVLDDADALVRDRVESYVSFLARRDFLHDTLFLEALLLENVNGGGGMFRLEVSHELRDNVKVWAGLDLFHGSDRNALGQFDREDRFVAGIKWYF
jgi:Protein of unknown function (DUF1302)